MYFETKGGRIWYAISDMLLVSRCTLRQRVVEYEITVLVRLSKISNDELDNLIRNYWNIYGIACGHSMILGHLSSIGIKVKQKCVTESLARADSDGCNMWTSLIIRREGIISLLQTVCGTQMVIIVWFDGVLYFTEK